MQYAADEILTIKQVAKALKLDPRTLKSVASALGGRRIGYRWRFKWSAVLEYFDNAKFDSEQRQSVDGKGGHQGQTSCFQNVPSRKTRRPRMASGQRVGRGTTQNSDDAKVDPHGLGTAYVLGE
ncbi:MAG: helix-turn-helix domain-containing protein [Pseudomonadota bacterium]